MLVLEKTRHMASNLPENCSIRLLSKSDCHTNVYTDSRTLFNINEISNEEKELLLWRTEGLITEANSNICAHHYSLLIKYYGMNFKSCDPSKKHKINVKSSLHSISLLMAKDAKNKSSVSLVPGHKICSNCRKTIFQGSCDADFENAHAFNDEDEIQQTDLPDITPVKQTDPEPTYAQ